MGHYRKPRLGAMLLAVAFVAGTAFVLFEDVVRHHAPITTAHVMTALALLGTLASGHFFISEVAGRRVISAAGCALMFIAGTACIVTLSGSRNAEVAAARADRIIANNQARTDELVRREAAQAMLDKARADMVRECSSGRGPRCAGRQASIDVYEAAIRGHDARLAELGPELKPNAGYAHAGRVFAALPYVTTEAVDITARLELIMPFLLVLITEAGTIVFGNIAFRRHTLAEPTRRDSLQTSFPTVMPEFDPPPANDIDPVGLEEINAREAKVREFVSAYMARHGKPPRHRDVMQACGLPRATASRYRARAIAA